jgi:hypothetical protein
MQVHPRALKFLQGIFRSAVRVKDGDYCVPVKHFSFPSTFIGLKRIEPGDLAAAAAQLSMHA